MTTKKKGWKPRLPLSPALRTLERRLSQDAAARRRRFPGGTVGDGDRLAPLSWAPNDGVLGKGNASVTVWGTGLAVMLVDMVLTSLVIILRGESTESTGFLTGSRYRAQVNQHPAEPKCKVREMKHPASRPSHSVGHVSAASYADSAIAHLGHPSVQSLASRRRGPISAHTERVAACMAGQFRELEVWLFTVRCCQDATSSRPHRLCIPLRLRFSLPRLPHSLQSYNRPPSPAKSFATAETRRRGSPHR